MEFGTKVTWIKDAGGDYEAHYRGVVGDRVTGTDLYNISKVQCKRPKYDKRWSGRIDTSMRADEVQVM